MPRPPLCTHDVPDPRINAVPIPPETAGSRRLDLEFSRAIMRSGLSTGLPMLISMPLPSGRIGIAIGNRVCAISPEAARHWASTLLDAI